MCYENRNNILKLYLHNTKIEQRSNKLNKMCLSSSIHLLVADARAVNQKDLEGNKKYLWNLDFKPEMSQS